MKKTTERIFFLSLFFACISILFVITSCEKDKSDGTEPKLIGTWHQVSQTIDGVPVSKDSTRLIMQINATNICILCDSSKVALTKNKIVSRSGWSYSAGLFNLAADVPASWKPVVNQETLSLEKVEFNQGGGLTKTQLTFERLADIEIN